MATTVTSYTINEPGPVDPRLESTLLKKRLRDMERRQESGREKFRADFILGAIRQNPLPSDMARIAQLCTEAESYVFGPLSEDE